MQSRLSNLRGGGGETKHWVKSTRRKINETQDSEGKAQRGSCHGRLGGQAALLEFCYLSAAESRPAEKGGGHCSKAGHKLQESGLIRPVCSLDSHKLSFSTDTDSHTWVSSFIILHLLLIIQDFTLKSLNKAWGLMQINSNEPKWYISYRSSKTEELITKLIFRETSEGKLSCQRN